MFAFLPSSELEISDVMFAFIKPIDHVSISFCLEHDLLESPFENICTLPDNRQCPICLVKLAC